MGRGLPFVGSNTTIRVFRHALSLDEVCNTAPPQLASMSLSGGRLHSTHLHHVFGAGLNTLVTWLTPTIFLIAPYQVPPKPVSPFSSCQSIVKVQEKRH